MAAELDPVHFAESKQWYETELKELLRQPELFQSYVK